MSLIFLLVFMATASPFWMLMIAAPRWRWTQRIVSTPWIVAPPLVFWFVLAIPRLGQLLPVVVKPTLLGWEHLLGSPAAATFVWAQIIAWDLFVGRWIYLDSRKRDIHPLVASPVLVVAMLLSPIAFPTYLVLRRFSAFQFVLFEPEVTPRATTLPASLDGAGIVRRAALGWHRPLMLFTVFAAVIGVVSVLGLIFDHRILVGVPIWEKPTKFAFSFGLYTLTFGWLLSLPRRHVKLGQKLGTITAVACFIELAAIVLQTIRGHRSHFNVSNAFDATMWATMALSITVLFVATALAAVVIMREGHAERPTLWALRLGMLISIAGMMVAFMMVISTSAQRRENPRVTIGSHSVGVPDGGPTMPFFGWSTTGGDLRIGHFVGIHGLQMVPLFAMLLGVLMTRIPRLRDERVRLRLVCTFAGGYGGLVLLVTWQALRKQPLVKPDALTITAFCVLMAGTLAAAVWALRAGKEPAPPAPVVREEVSV